jgi:hypothetical protein
MANFRVEIQTSGLDIRVYDDDKNKELTFEAPPSASTTAVVDVLRDTAGRGCWFVHDLNAGESWGWSSGNCDPLPTLQFKVNEQGKVKDPSYEDSPGHFKKLDRGVRIPVSASVRLTISVAKETYAPSGEEIDIFACYYVVIGGRAYKIC